MTVIPKNLPIYIQAEIEWLQNDKIPLEYDNYTIRFKDLTAAQITAICLRHRTMKAHGLLLHDEFLGLLIRFVKPQS
jgi:hypothetical protein